MSRSLLLAWFVVTACTRADTPSADRPEPQSPSPVARPGVGAPPPPAPAPTPAPPPVAPSTVTVEMTAVTLADDCGGTPPWSAPALKAEKQALKADEAADSKRKAKRRCEQTSMQLSVSAAATGTPTRIAIRKVELFDDAGGLVGVLTPSVPTQWSSASSQYVTWDEMIAPGQNLAVSYVLSQPDWDRVSSRWNRTYTLKAVVAVGGSDTSVQKDVEISAPTSLPPNVKT